MHPELCNHTHGFAGPSRIYLTSRFNHKKPSAAGPQPKFGISRAKTPRPQRSDDNGETFLIDYSSFLSELGVLCALARVNPRVRVQVRGKFARTAQSFNYRNTKRPCLFRKYSRPFSILQALGYNYNDLRMKKLLVLQHVAHELLGTLNPLLKQSGFRIRCAPSGCAAELGWLRRHGDFGWTDERK
jgi:hypothetical protein